tara:strand:- start:1489 stop:1800 length:312 start_codon:yes stop_codon:yes gene_type:complete
MTFQLLTNLKFLVKELSSQEIKHIDPLRMRITLQGLIDAEENQMSEYNTGFIPEILCDINDLIDLANDIMVDKSNKHEQLFTLALSLSLLKEKISKEFIGDVE